MSNPGQGWEEKASGDTESDGQWGLPLLPGGSGAPHPPRKSWGYLFRWSRRKRKVSRLASGSDSSKLSMQLSFATGSERATGRGQPITSRGHWAQDSPGLSSSGLTQPQPQAGGPATGACVRTGLYEHLFSIRKETKAPQETLTGGTGHSYGPTRPFLPPVWEAGCGMKCAGRGAGGLQGPGDSLITLCTMDQVSY